jgi:hypothetical protein
MGSLLSRISDDEDDYDYLCTKYGEDGNQGKLYGVHHDWLIELDNGNTKLSFEEYKANRKLDDMRKRVESLQNEIVKLVNERDETLRKIAEMKIRR